MAEASNKLAIFIENLKDAGCDENKIKECVRYFSEEEYEQLKKELIKHKSNLLCTLHDKQEQIDCLDYLFYKINKKEK